MIRSLINKLHRKNGSGDEWVWIITNIISKIKSRQNPIMLELKTSFHMQNVMAFGQGGDSVLRYHTRLYEW